MPIPNYYLEGLQVNHKLSITIATMVGTIVTTSALLGYNPLSAQDTMRLKDNNGYIGLWAGVDEVDGGHSLRSILPAESGFKVIGRDTWHGPCGYGDPAVILATLSAEGKSLKGTWHLDCQAGETAETGDRLFEVRYTFDPSTKTLTETLLDPQTEKPINRIPIVFFRIAP